MQLRVMVHATNSLILEHVRCIKITLKAYLQTENDVAMLCIIFMPLLFF